MEEVWIDSLKGVSAGIGGGGVECTKYLLLWYKATDSDYFPSTKVLTALGLSIARQMCRTVWNALIDRRCIGFTRGTFTDTFPWSPKTQNTTETAVSVPNTSSVCFIFTCIFLSRYFHQAQKLERTSVFNC